MANLTKISKEELYHRLKLHEMFLEDSSKGKRLYLSYHDLEGVNLENANLRKANLEGAELKYANLEGANLNNANLRASNLSYAKLNDAKLGSACLVGAYLYFANLSNAYLYMADLQNATLKSSKVVDANLGRADLNNASLTNANLYGANLRGAILWNCIGNNKEVVTLQLDPYIVTMAKDIIQIGSEAHGYEEWDSFSDDEIESMYSGTDFWKENKELILKQYKKRFMN